MRLVDKQGIKLQKFSQIIKGNKSPISKTPEDRVDSGDLPVQSDEMVMK